MQLYILLFEVLFLIGCVKWGIPLWQKTFKKDDITVGYFLNIVAGLSSLAILGGAFFTAFYENTDLLLPTTIIFLASAGSILTAVFQNNKKISFCFTVLLCATGLFLLPEGITLSYTNFQDILFKFISLISWIFFIWMMHQFDRIPLFSFSVFSVLFLTASIMCTNIFPFLPALFQPLCLLALTTITLNSFLFKNRGIFCLGPSFIFFISYIIGYFGYCLSANGLSAGIPIFIAYELMEILLAIGTNIFLYHKLSPIQTPFFIEKVFSKGINLTKAMRKIFSINFFFAMLGLLTTYTIQKNVTIFNINNMFFMYGCTIILLFNIYLTFHNWGKTNAELKNLFKDIKNGLATLKDEFKKNKK